MNDRSGTLAVDTLGCALLALVVSWWLGLEQVLPGLVLIVGAALLWRRKALDGGLEVVFFALFLLWSLTSMPALDGAAEWLLYARGEVHLALGLVAYLVGLRIAPESAAFGRWLRRVAAFTGVLTATSLLILLGALALETPPHLSVWRSLEGTSEFVDQFLVARRLGTTFGVSMIPGIDRQSLYFLYQGGLATVLLLVGGWLLVARHRLAGAWRGVAVAGVGAALLLVPLTGSRSGVALSWGVVAALVAWRAIEPRPWRRWVVRGIVLALLVGALVAVVPRGDRGRLHDGAPWEKVLIDFRVKSFLDRLEVYTETVDKLNQRPWTGWGIQGRPGERDRYLRLGTHSEPLNVAYRFGWVGLGLWTLAGLAFVTRFVRASRGRPDRPEWILLLAALGLTALVRTFQWDLNVYWLVMAFLGTSVARARPSDPPDEITVLGTRLHPRTLEELNGEIASAVDSGRQLVIGHQNLHGLYLLGRDETMRRFAERADRIFIDGMAVVWLARALGHAVERRHRVTYADWLDPLAAECARRGWRLFHLGGRPGVGESARKALVAAHPGLEMATLPGYFELEDEPRIRAAIDDFAPQVLMVGMGMPRQEAWVLRNAGMIGAPAILTCGACMDYRAGVVVTPPRWAGRAGLEWLFRLIREPRRLAFRYLIEPWPVLIRFLAEYFRT